MTMLWIVLLGFIALAAFVGFYYSLVNSLYVEKLRTTEVATITAGDIWKLRMCRYRKGRTTGEPVLLVHGAATNQHNFTVPEGESLVDYLVAKGYDCWTIDLRGTRTSQPPFERSRWDADLDGMLLYDLPAAINHIRQCTGYGQVHWVGHSLGGMLLYAYLSTFEDDHLSCGVTLGSPPGFKGLDIRIPGMALLMVRCFPGLCGAFIRGNLPFNRLLRHAPRFFPANVRNLNPALSTGHLVNLIEDPLPRVARQLALWARDQQWLMDRGKVDVDAGIREITLPLQLFYGVRDRLTPPEMVKEFYDALPATDKEMHLLSREHGYVEDYDHCDLLFSKNAEHEVYEQVAAWLARHPIHSRLSPEEMGGKSGEYVEPLPPKQREAILSGASYAHLSSEMEFLPQSSEMGMALQLEAADGPAPAELTGEVKSVGRRRAPRASAAKKPAASKKATSTARKPAPKKAPAKKPVAKPTPKAKVAQAAAKKVTKKKPKPKAKSQAAPKQAAARKGAPASDGQVKVPERTRRALNSAAAQLRELDSKKKE